MERNLILKRCKGLLALVLAFVVIFGSGIHIMAEEGTSAVLVTTNYNSGTDYSAPDYSRPKGSQEATSVGGGKHVHDYQWTVTLQPMDGTDGKREAVCNCGAVDGREPISYYRIVIKSIIESIEEAPVNGTVTVNNPFLSCLTDEIMEALHKRGDVNLQVAFKEDEQDFSFMVPAGKALLEDEWYGYYYLGSVFGWQ